MGDIHYHYDDAPTIKAFSQSKAFLRGLMGPFGCISGSTRVYTEHGLIPISDIARPMRVLAWDAKTRRFRLAASGGAFPKGRDCLYRVTTQRGVFDAAGFHRVLCADGKYRRVDSLRPGEQLESLPSRLEKRCAAGRLWCDEDDRHWTQIVADWMGSYAESARRYGQQFLRAEDSALTVSPSPADAQELFQCVDRGAIAGRDGGQERTLSHTHFDQCDGLQRIDGCEHPSQRRRQVSAGLTWYGLFSRSAERHQASARSLWKSVIHHLRQVWPFDSWCTSKRTIISIDRLAHEEAYWDLQVADLNNYVTEDGAIHHNSGKSSGCVIEIIKWAARQHVQADGKRRARFAIIRNSYPQLKDTTIRTFFDWVPPQAMGKFMKQDHDYLINRMAPDLEIEIMFRALDRPEQIANLLSLELTGAWVNEAREIPWPIIKALQGRVNRYPAKKDGGAVDAGIIMDTNPPDEDSWWYKIFEEHVDPVSGTPMIGEDMVAVFKQPSGRSENAENRKYLPDNYYSQMMIGADPEFIKVYVDGEYGFVIDGRPVYPEYSDTTHCQEIQPIKGKPIKRGWDFGLFPACVFTQVAPDGRFLVLDELHAEDLSQDSFADAVNLHSSQEYPGFTFEDYGDPAGAQRSSVDKDLRSSFDILKGKGILIQPSEQNLTIRLESVRKPLNSLVQGKPQLVISPKCKTLRKGFMGGYQYKKLKVAGAHERYHAEPDKNEYSHPHDGLQYVAVKVFGNAVRSRAENARKPLKLDLRGVV